MYRDVPNQVFPGTTAHCRYQQCTNERATFPKSNLHHSCAHAAGASSKHADSTPSDISLSASGPGLHPNLWQQECVNSHILLWTREQTSKSVSNSRNQQQRHLAYMHALLNAQMPPRTRRPTHCLITIGLLKHFKGLLLLNANACTLKTQQVLTLISAYWLTLVLVLLPATAARGDQLFLSHLNNVRKFIQRKASSHTLGITDIEHVTFWLTPPIFKRSKILTHVTKRCFLLPGVSC